MRIAVVIPALSEAERIQRAIQSARAPGVEIIVADGGSRDATRSRAAEAGARVICSEPGRARQLQTGLEATGADTILFLHADTLLPSGWVTEVRDALADPAVVGGAFDLRFREPGVALRLVEWGVRLRLRLARLPYGDQALFARRSALESIGGVPQVPIMEDLDLVRGLKRTGRLALLARPVETSARRYLDRGVFRMVGRNTLALLAVAFGVDRARIAAWYRS